MTWQEKVKELMKNQGINIEKYVPVDDSIRVLYKIDRITYDVVNSDEPQDTTVYMNLYYFEE